MALFPPQPGFTGSRNQEVEVGLAPLMITSSDPLAKFLLPFPPTLCSVSLEVMVSHVGMLLPGDTTMIPLNWKLKMPPSHVWLLLTLNQEVKKEVLAGVNKSDC